MHQWRIALQPPVLFIQTILGNNFVNGLFQRGVVKSTALNQRFAVVDPRSQRIGHHASDVPPIDFGAKHFLGDNVVLIDGIGSCHAKPKQHDANDAASTCACGQFEIVRGATLFFEALSLLDSLHDFFEDDEGCYASDAAAIESEEADAVEVPCCREVDHCAVVVAMLCKRKEEERNVRIV